MQDRICAINSAAAIKRAAAEFIITIMKHLEVHQAGGCSAGSHVIAGRVQELLADNASRMRHQLRISIERHLLR
jgi:hypothetical protein